MRKTMSFEQEYTRLLDELNDSLDFLNSGRTYLF